MRGRRAVAAPSRARRRANSARANAGTLNPHSRHPEATSLHRPLTSPPPPPFLLQGVNIMMFCKEYNARTQDQAGMIIPVEITVFEVRRPSRHAPRARHATPTRGCPTASPSSATFSDPPYPNPPRPLNAAGQVLHLRPQDPPASVLLKKAAGVDKGSAQLEKVGSITRDQLEEIAKIKMPDLNAHKVESAMRVVAGTAANMGITIDGWDMEESKQGFREEKAALYGMEADQFA